jgi:hypothetical protein
VAAPLAADAAPVTRTPDGRVADVASAKELGRRGGHAKARRVRLLDTLGLAHLADSVAFAPYRRAAEAFVEHHVAELGKVAGGQVDAGPSSMVASAALQLAASRFVFDRAATRYEVALFKLASSLADASRQNLIAAYEIAVRMAQARKARPVQAWRDPARKTLTGATVAPSEPEKKT